MYSLTYNRSEKLKGFRETVTVQQFSKSNTTSILVPHRQNIFRENVIMLVNLTL